MEKTRSKGNLKEKFKKHWKIALVLSACLVLLVGAGLSLFLLKRNSQETLTEPYTIQVQNSQGIAVEEVYVVLCAEDGTELNWLPYVTNLNGKVQFYQGVEKGSYVKILSVPAGYKVEENVRYTFDENGEVLIVLAEDDAAYEAQIGDTKYFSLITALGVANSAEAEMTIDLLTDVTMKSFKCTNAYDAKITLNGNGYTVTLEGDNNAFVVNQKNGELIFENVNFVHKNTGAIVQVNSLTTISLIDVNVDATQGTAYNYALFNTLAVDGTTTLNMTRVNVKMAVGTSGQDDYAGVIRTGNTSGTKNVNINLDSCNFDTTGATGRHGIIVMKNTIASLNIKNSNIKAADAYAVYAVEQTKAQTMTTVNSKYTSEAYPNSAVKGYYAQIGNTYYLPMEAATEIANNSNSDITLKLFSDFTMKTASIHNKKGKLVTIDGGGKTITTNGGSNAFVVGGNVAFKNMTINHMNTGSVVQMTEVANVTLTDVNMNATEGKTYAYCLINMLAAGEKSTLSCTRVNATMAVESKGNDDNAAIIRTGNGGDADKKTVEIKLQDCNFDTTKATGRSAIVIMKTTTATVDITNSKLMTMDDFVIRSNEQEINWNNADTTLDSLSQTYHDYPVEWYLAKIGDVFYTLKGALEVANAAATDTTIKLMANYTIKSYDVMNEKGQTITIDGNGKTITCNAGNNAFVLGKNVAMKNMKIVHKNAGSAIQVSKAGNISLENIVIDATTGAAYNYALINIMAADNVTNLNLNNVDVTMSVAGAGANGKEAQQSAILRTGNEGKSNAKTININMKDCEWNAVKATGRSGIVVMKDTTANINIANSNIKTLDEAPIRARENSSLAYTLTIANTILDSETKAFKNEPVRGYDAKIGDVYYHDLADALNVAKASASDITLTLAQDITVKENIDIINEYGAGIVFDGNGYKVTATGGNNTFRIQKPENSSVGEVELKNMKIVHKNGGSVVQVNVPTTVNVTDVEIDATQPDSTYYYALINVLGADKNATTYLNLTNVDLNMDDAKSNTGNKQAIIRTGNEGNNHEKNVEIKIVDSKLDASDAANRNVLRIMNTTHAKVTIENSTLMTNNVSAVQTDNRGDGQATVTGNDFVCGKKTDNFKGYAAKIGDIYYCNFNDAITQALAGSTIEILSDITVNNVDLDKALIIDGKDHTITTTGTAYAFKIKEAVAVEVKNVKFAFNSKGVAIRTEVAGADVNLTNVDITSTADVDYSLVNLLGYGEATTKLTLNNVNIDMDAESYINFPAIIRTGNSQAKHVEINIKDSKLDASDAVDRHIIRVMSGTNADIKVENSILKTDNVSAIMCHNTSEGQATITDTDVICDAQVDKLTGYILQLNDTWYVGETLYNALNDVTEDITIVLSTDLSLDLSKINNKNGKMITIDPNGYKLEVSGNSDSVIILRDTEVIINGQTRYFSVEEAISVANNATEDVTIKFKIDYELDLTHLTNVNGKKITIDPNGNTITGKGTLWDTVTVAGCKAAYTVGSVTYFVSDFTEALSQANVATGGATITLFDDVAIETCSIVNNITVDGNNHTITSTGENNANNAITIDAACTVELKNLKIVHKNTGSVVQFTKAGADVTLSKVTIDATTPKSTYYYALINMVATGKDVTTKLKLDEVTVDMVADSNQNQNKAIVRTGNGNNKVDITIKDSTLDASRASGRNGLAILGTTEATVTLTDTTIKTLDAAPIKDDSASASIRKTRYLVDVTSPDWDNAVAYIGNTPYNSFATAITAANASAANARIELLTDVEVTTALSINNAQGKNITIDGNLHEITTNTKHAMKVDYAGNVNFANMDIKHIKEQTFIQVNKIAKVSLTDVNVTAEENGTTNFQWAIINVPAKDNTVDNPIELNLTRVNLTMKTGDYGNNKENSVIRTGNRTETKFVNINLTDCNLNLSEAVHRIGINIMHQTTATVNLINTTIQTNEALKVYDYSGNATINDNEQTSAAISLENQNEGTKQLILDVPVRIYDAFIKWIKQFAKVNDWDLNL